MKTNQKFSTAATLALMCAASAGNAASSADHFDKVPSDTPFYVGTTEDERWVENLGLGDAESLRQALSKLSGDSESQSHPAGKFIQLIAEAMLQGGAGGSELVAQPGRAQLYLQGLSPVVRLQLLDGKLFSAYLQKQAKMPAPAVQQITEDGQQIWAPTGGQAEVFAAVDGDDLVLSRLNKATGFTGIKSLVLGGDGFDPEKKMLPALTKYDMPGTSVGWLDFERIKTSVTDPEHVLHSVVEAMVADEQKWEQFLSPACQGDVQRFIDNTPHLVGAAGHVQASGKNALHSAFVWPMQNEKSRAAWQGLQGLVLAQSETTTPVRLGLGVSGTGVPGFVNYLAADLSALQCPLWREQAAQSGMGLAMASSMSAMFSTVKGVTAQVFDVELDANNNPDPRTLDAQLTVLTDSPSLLLLMMRSMLTLPANIPEDGTPVSVETPLGFPVQLAVYPHSINVYLGKSADASVKSMKSGVATESALLNYAVDVMWALTKSSNAMPGKSPEELLREKGVESMVPLSAEGGIRHLPYGMRMESNAIYAAPGEKKAVDAVVAKADK